MDATVFLPSNIHTSLQPTVSDATLQATSPKNGKNEKVCFSLKEIEKE
jgi:hypothetical protein